MGIWYDRWHREGGYRQVLLIAVPLILSTGAWSVQHFVDRMFLAWYSAEAIAACMPAGMVFFTIMSLFMGTAGYTNTFVAQYHGAGRCERIGPILWQGVYIGILAAGVHALIIPLGPGLFRFAGHDPVVQEMEVAYFQILSLGAGPGVVSAALAGFYTGRGRPWAVMWVNTVGTAVNLLLDYILIFGRWGFPEWGIRGAALATVVAMSLSCAMYVILLFPKRLDARYQTRSGWALNRDLLRRLLKFGLPSGIQFFLDMVGFTAFLLVVGRLGTTQLAATNVALNINNIAFMPMLGFGIAVSVLVGQHLGANRPQLAQRAVYSSSHLTIGYMVSVAACYALIPEVFIRPFAAQADPVTFSAIHEAAVVLLRFVAVYSVFDALNIVFASAIKGAGDTRFVMITIALTSSLGLVLPAYIGLVILGGGIYTAWAIAACYISLLGIIFLLRFLGGKWKSMRVIESEAT